MHIRELEAFLVLADELNFRRAADRLTLSQPGLTSRIRSLERELGVRLFSRDRSGTRLTAAGQRLRPLAAAAVHATNDIVDAAHDPTPQHRRHQLRVGVLADGLGPRTWPLIRDFAAARPDVDIVLTQLSFDQAFTAVRRGTADVVLITGPATADDTQHVTTIDTMPVSVLLTAGNPRTEQTNVDLEWVARHLTFDTLPHFDREFRRFWILETLRSKATRHNLTTLRTPPEGPLIDVLATQFGRTGGVGLFPSGLPIPAASGCVLRELDRPFDAPRQILSAPHHDHARQFLRLAQNA